MVISKDVPTLGFLLHLSALTIQSAKTCYVGHLLFAVRKVLAGSNLRKEASVWTYCSRDKSHHGGKTWRARGRRLLVGLYLEVGEWSALTGSGTSL